jgi:hypothetical protein
LRILAGANSSDAALVVNNQANTQTFLELFGDGHGILGYNGTGATIQWSTAGIVQINAPSAGIALKVIGSGDNSATILTQDDTGGIEWANTAGTLVGFLTTVKRWTGAGGDVTDAAIAARSSMLFYATNSTTATMQITSSAISGLGPVAGALVDMTPDTSTFTLTLSTVTGGTGTCTWVRVGKQVTLYFPVITGTSTGVTNNATGLPSAIQPATLTQTIQMAYNSLEDNTAEFGAGCSVLITAASGTLSFLKNGANNWTNGGTKGIATATSISYLLS